MEFKADIGIIGALEDEVREIISRLDNKTTEKVGSIEFNLGELFGKKIVIARCGVGKVFAAICAEAMIIKYSPALIVNSGVGGALDKTLRPCDIVFADKLVQHDMDTSPIGDPVGLISGINRIYFETDERARRVLVEAAAELGVNYLVGTVATGDKFISAKEDKDRITSLFAASACEMEGGAIAHTAFVNGTPFMVVRAISDSADGDACMDYPTFLPIATKTSTALTLALIEKY
ncbi:MAG: 5'-methylthioadenosine/adenosylhomocysteine nucleosidase [Clostridia bacterium]|nr:5'-methylthioadenosine/adenosylhomocysteine nucleosidase [Clostridia bacterium]